MFVAAVGMIFKLFNYTGMHNHPKNQVRREDCCGQPLQIANRFGTDDYTGLFMDFLDLLASALPIRKILRIRWSCPR